MAIRTYPYPKLEAETSITVSGNAFICTVLTAPADVTVRMTATDATGDEIISIPVTSGVKVYLPGLQKFAQVRLLPSGLKEGESINAVFIIGDGRFEDDTFTIEGGGVFDANIINTMENAVPIKDNGIPLRTRITAPLSSSPLGREVFPVTTKVGPLGGQERLPFEVQIGGNNGVIPGDPLYVRTGEYPVEVVGAFDEPLPIANSRDPFFVHTIGKGAGRSFNNFSGLGNVPGFFSMFGTINPDETVNAGNLYSPSIALLMRSYAQAHQFAFCRITKLAVSLYLSHPGSDALARTVGVAQPRLIKMRRKAPGDGVEVTMPADPGAQYSTGIRPENSDRAAPATADVYTTNPLIRPHFEAANFVPPAPAPLDGKVYFRLDGGNPSRSRFPGVNAADQILPIAIGKIVSWTPDQASDNNDGQVPIGINIDLSETPVYLAQGEALQFGMLDNYYSTGPSDLFLQRVTMQVEGWIATNTNHNI